MRLLWILALATYASAACVPIEEAVKHVDKNACVHGKVLSVSATSGGTHLLRFCDEGRQCGFSAVVFRRDLRQVGDIRTLEGKEVDIEGKISLYHGHPEIIVRDWRQIKGAGARLPPIPKNYDVAKEGKVSPGERPSSRHKPAKYSHRSVDALTETGSEPE